MTRFVSIRIGDARSPGAGGSRLVFCYLPRLPDSDPADSPALITAVPNWDNDEVFQTGGGSSG
jgi:hypothetical protein